MPNTASSLVRLAKGSDARAIAELSRELVEQGLSWRWRATRVLRAMKDADSIVIVAVEDNQIVGFALMSCAYRSAHLNLFAVQPSYRRTGIGSRLLEWLIKSCQTAGIGRINLEVRKGNASGIHFYERHHFEPVGLRRGYYDGVEDAILMSLRLFESELEEHRI